MEDHRGTTAYKKAFETFLRHTDEKPLLLAAIKRWLLANPEPRSLLDIGAGNGEIAIPLSTFVSEYVAVEARDDYAAILRAQGIQVITEHYPQPLVVGEFGAVLISHALPWKEEKYVPFLKGAWGHVEVGGRLLVITYDEDAGEWSNFLERTGLHQHGAAERMFTLQSTLASFGEMKVEVLRTHVRTDTLDDMIDALAFVYSDGKPEKIEEFVMSTAVRAELKRYCTKALYEFPFEHYFLSVRKQ